MMAREITAGMVILLRDGKTPVTVTSSSDCTRTYEAVITPPQWQIEWIVGGETRYMVYNPGEQIAVQVPAP